MLQRRPGVVDLVKVGGVHIGGLGRPLLRLVKEGGALLVHVGGGQRRVPRPEGQLAQPQALGAVHLGGGDAEELGGDGSGGIGILGAVVVQVNDLPLEQGVVRLIQRKVGPAGPVGGVLQRIGAGADDGEVGHLVHLYRLAEGEGDGVSPLENGVAFGGVGVAQPEEGGESVYHRQEQQRQGVLALHGVPLEGEGRPAGLLLRHGDPLQRVFPGGGHLPEIDVKGDDRRQRGNGPHPRRLHIAEEPRQAVDHAVPRAGETLPHGEGGGLRVRGGGKQQSVHG